MCQECVPQPAANTDAGEQLPRHTTGEAPHTVSFIKLISLLLLSFLGCIAIAGLLIWLVLWLQPQFTAL